MTEPTGPATTDLDARFSEPEQPATAWTEAEHVLIAAEIYWISSLRQDGRISVAPLFGIWRGDAFHFCTGPTEQKARNIERHPQCTVTTGTNAGAGLDVVLEGEAVPVIDEGELTELSLAWERKYGTDWHFDVLDGAFGQQGNRVLVFQLRPDVAFGFGRLPYTQTRWRF